MISKLTNSSAARPFGTASVAQRCRHRIQAVWEPVGHNVIASMLPALHTRRCDRLPETPRLRRLHLHVLGQPREFLAVGLEQVVDEGVAMFCHGIGVLLELLGYE